MKHNESDLLIIREEEAGLRLDKILASRFQGKQSRTYFQFLIEQQQVTVNGFPLKKRYLAKKFDEIQINFILTPEINLTPEPIPLDVIYEDEDLIIVNKPANMVVHPAPGNWQGTFVNALLYHCKQLPESSNLRPGIVHRLDKDTSGLLIAAKTAMAQQRLIEMFSRRQIHKEYLAICLGNPGCTTINAPIGRHPIHRQKMAVVVGGKEALTHCNTLAFNSKISLVNIHLATGRTHQIRVHMKHLGHPVLGDAVYGNPQINPEWGVERQMLHASFLKFIHPINGHPLEFKADIPNDMHHFLTHLIRNGSNSSERG